MTVWSLVDVFIRVSKIKGSKKNYLFHLTGHKRKTKKSISALGVRMADGRMNILEYSKILYDDYLT